MVVAPHLDGVFIPLACARFRFLSTMLDGREEATAMGRMIAHAKLALDHLGDSCGGPDLPAEPERFCPPGQQFRQLRPLLWVQFPGAQPSSFAPILWKWCVCVHTSFYRLFSSKL